MLIGHLKKLLIHNSANASILQVQPSNVSLYKTFKPLHCICIQTISYIVVQINICIYSQTQVYKYWQSVMMLSCIEFSVSRQNLMTAFSVFSYFWKTVALRWCFVCVCCMLKKLLVRRWRVCIIFWWLGGFVTCLNHVTLIVNYSMVGWWFIIIYR